MCIKIIITYKLCGHQEKHHRRCPTSFKRATPGRKRDIWRSFFGCSSKPCPPPKTKKVELRSYCSACNEERYKRTQQQERMRDARSPEESARKTFRCSACIAEHRYYSERERRANEGLCCTRGVDEWRERERQRRKAPGYRKPVPVSRSQATFHTNVRPTVPQFTREERFPQLKRMTSTQVARDAAILAAERYGWHQRAGSHDLEPQLVADFVNSSGVAMSSLPKAPTPPKPLYLDPGIDWKQWNKAVMTNHGRYPPAAPAPEAPLPIRPLQIRKTMSKRGESASGRAELADNLPIIPEPLSIKKHQPGKRSAIPGRQAASISPPRSWSPSDDIEPNPNWTPVSFRQSSRRTASPAVSPLSRSPASSERRSHERLPLASSRSPATPEGRWSDDRPRTPPLEPQDQLPQDLRSVASRIDVALAEAWKYLEDNE